MLPTLWGRIQSRIFFTAVVGGIVTAIVAAIIPATLDTNGVSIDIGTSDRFQDAFVILLWTGVIGIVWECVYHFLMQWRWEKDWPTFFGFITIVNEGAVVYFLGDNGVLPWIKGWDADPRPDHLIPVVFFVVQFVLVWLAVWVWTNGPMRVFNIHWRFFGGRLV
jgi:hypothetical protein